MMTKLEMRIAIAQSLGWERHDSTSQSGDVDYWTSPDKVTGTFEPPNYPQDLNACREFEQKLNKEEIEYEDHTYSERDTYLHFLEEQQVPLCAEEEIYFLTITATAEQRCIAYLLVRGYDV